MKRYFLISAIILIHIIFYSPLKGQETIFIIEPRIEKDTAWYEVSKWGVEGRGWRDVQRFYDRLPAKAEKMVRKEVWNLSRNSAGMSVRFYSDAREIFIRYSLLSSNLSMAHMPATGVSGVDLYIENKSGKWEWIASSKPKSKTVNEVLVKKLLPGKKKFLLYLPLYNGIDSLFIGVPESSAFISIFPRREKPIVFYGTSIMQGGCASRPGMAFSSILGRRLNKPTINLGFSGNGRMDTSVAELLAELDPCLYVVDCLPNMNADEVKVRTKPLVEKIREKHPLTPILLVEDRTIQGCMFTAEKDSLHNIRRGNLKAEYKKLKDSGVKNLFYLEGKDLLGDDGEATVDGSHPTDLGMVRYANAYEPVLRKILKMGK
jgi:hypothetical protein